jgi:hypothetical protein
MLKLVLLLSLFLRTMFCFSQDERVQSVLNALNMDSVLLDVQRMSGEIPIQLNGQSVFIKSRLYDNIGNERTFAFAKKRFQSYGLTIDSLVFSKDGKNLMAIKKGSIFPERMCIIGAHYDNIPTGSIAPGADDNASGCAIVLEAARIMSTRDYPNTVVFALWDEEEIGLIGSRAFATQFVTESDSLLAYLNLDMLAWDGNKDKLSEVHVRPVANSLAMADLTVSCNALYTIGLNLKVVNPGSVNTDHSPFWDTDLTAFGINEPYTGNDQNPHRHELSDTLGTFDLAYYEMNGRLTLATFTSLALNKSGFLSTEEIISHPQLFPNPTQHTLHVKFQQAIVVPLTITLFDYAGKIVLEQVYQKVDEIELDMDPYRKGSYTLKLATSESNSTFPIVKL